MKTGMHCLLASTDSLCRTNNSCVKLCRLAVFSILIINIEFSQFLLFSLLQKFIFSIELINLKLNDSYGSLTVSF